MMLAKTETAGLHNFQMIEQSLVDEIKSGNKVIRENGGKKAVAEENLDVTLKELSSDLQLPASNFQLPASIF